MSERQNVDWFDRCPVTGGRKGWCLPGHEEARDAARIAHAQKAVQPNTPMDRRMLYRLAGQFQAKRDADVRGKRQGWR